MFKKLFGSSNNSGAATAQKKPAQQATDPHETMNRLGEQIENVEKRIKKIDADMKRLTMEALEKKKAKDTRGALFALKRKKMLEKEVAKLDGQMTLLESQKLMIETSIQDASVFQALNAGSTAVDQLNRQVGVDQLEDLKDKIEEQQQEMDEKQDFFVRAGQIDDADDLMDELNELEAQLAEEELDVEIGAGAVEYGQKQGGQQQIKPKAQQSEEDELRQLEMLMS